MGAQRGLKMTLNPLKLELQQLWTALYGCWELEASPLKAAGALGAESSLQSFIKDFLKNCI